MDNLARTKRIFLSLALAGMCALAPVPVVMAQESADFRWSITPYVWAPTTVIDLSYQGTDIGGGVINVSDVMDKIDTALMLNVEYGKGHWSVFADLTYVDASDTVVRPLTTVDTRFEQFLLDAGVSWWPRGVGSSLNVIAGVRHTGSDNRFTFTGTPNGMPLGSLRSNDDVNDALLGLRYRFNFTDRWNLYTRGDYSFGGTDGTFLLSANFAYTVGKSQQNQFMFGYQYKESKLKDGDLTTDITFHGPNVGFNFRF